MISKPTHPLGFELLSIDANNFNKLNKQWQDTCLHSFGASGDQLRQMIEIPLEPFNVMPHKNDLVLHTITQVPIPFEYVYEHRELTDHEKYIADDLFAPEYKIFMDNIPLTQLGQ